MILQKTKDLLNKANMQINPDKSEIKKLEVVFLGHKLTERKILKLLDNKDGVNKYPTPKTIKQVQEFLGLANYYRKFIKGMAEIAKPLYNLLKKDQEFKWTEECKEAFKN